ncbi:hypothetical protein B1A99_34205 [Cohnella sp. CIP 111063]|nr:hypothetical protein B1A99_34205 [Cohnella sp. CIP 111063]PRX58272.1 iron complex transport system substrate-binding protein [Cohnella sp. SGD-V74]
MKIMFKLGNHRPIGGIWLCLVASLLLLLAACGTDKPSASTGSTPPASTAPAASTPSESSADNSSGETTRTFNTVMGDVEIPAHPQRIIAQGLLPYFLMFDVKPIGSTNWEIQYPHLAGLTDGIEDTGFIDGASVEKILSLQPDLIVTVEPTLYEPFSKIAPTVVIPYDKIGDVHADTRLFGELLGEKDKAEQILAEFDRKTAETRDKLRPVLDSGETFSLIGAFDKTHYIYGRGIYRGGLTMYKYIGLQAPPLIQEQVIDKNKDLLEISLEKIPEYAGDHIFLDVSNGAEFDESSGLWQSIDAVKNGNVHKLDTDIFWPYDPLAISQQMDELVKMLLP